MDFWEFSYMMKNTVLAKMSTVWVPKIEISWLLIFIPSLFADSALLNTHWTYNTNPKHTTKTWYFDLWTCVLIWPPTHCILRVERKKITNSIEEGRLVGLPSQCRDCVSALVRNRFSNAGHRGIRWLNTQSSWPRRRCKMIRGLCWSSSACWCFLLSWEWEWSVLQSVMCLHCDY